MPVDNPMPFLDRASCERVFEVSMIPTWMMDTEPTRYVWANAAALELLQAESLEELCARDLVTDTPQPVIERSKHIFAQVRAGHPLREEFTLYPGGKPCPLLMDYRGVELGAGRVGALIQGLRLEHQSPVEARSIAIFRHSSFIAALVRPNGAIVSQNPAATAVFGPKTRWSEWFETPARASSMLDACLAETSPDAPSLVRVEALEGAAWHLVETRPVRDPVSAELCVLVEHIDVSARVEAEQLAEARGQRIDSLSAALELVEQQRQAILELSAPALEVGAGTLAVPIVGRLERERLDSLTARLLEHVSRRRTTTVLLDLTGVETIDAGSVDHLQRLVRALGLLGARPMLTGVQPSLARAWTLAGIELGTLPCYRSLAEGLRHAGAHQ